MFFKNYCCGFSIGSITTSLFASRASVLPSHLSVRGSRASIRGSRSSVLPSSLSVRGSCASIIESRLSVLPSSLSIRDSCASVLPSRLSIRESSAGLRDSAGRVKLSSFLLGQKKIPLNRGIQSQRTQQQHGYCFAVGVAVAFLLLCRLNLSLNCWAMGCKPGVTGAAFCTWPYTCKASPRASLPTAVNVSSTFCVKEARG